MCVCGRACGLASVPLSPGATRKAKARTSQRRRLDVGGQDRRVHAAQFQDAFLSPLPPLMSGDGGSTLRCSRLCLSSIGSRPKFRVLGCNTAAVDSAEWTAKSLLLCRVGVSASVMPRLHSSQLTKRSFTPALTPARVWRRVSSTLLPQGCVWSLTLIGEM